MPHINNHPHRPRPAFIADNARPHRARAVQEVCEESDAMLPRSVRCPGLNPIAHIWDITGRLVREKAPPIQILDALTQTRDKL